MIPVENSFKLSPTTSKALYDLPAILPGKPISPYLVSLRSEGEKVVMCQLS